MDESYEAHNVVVGVLSCVRGSFLYIPVGDITIQIPLKQVLCLEVLGPDWRWHKDLDLDETSFSGHLALEKEKQNAERTR